MIKRVVCIISIAIFTLLLVSCGNSISSDNRYEGDYMTFPTLEDVKNIELSDKDREYLSMYYNDGYVADMPGDEIILYYKDLRWNTGINKPNDYIPELTVFVYGENAYIICMAAYSYNIYKYNLNTYEYEKLVNIDDFEPYIYTEPGNYWATRALKTDSKIYILGRADGWINIIEFDVDNEENGLSYKGRLINESGENVDYSTFEELLYRNPGSDYGISCRYNGGDSYSLLYLDSIDNDWYYHTCELSLNNCTISNEINTGVSFSDSDVYVGDVADTLYKYCYYEQEGKDAITGKTERKAYITEYSSDTRLYANDFRVPYLNHCFSNCMAKTTGDYILYFGKDEYNKNSAFVIDLNKRMMESCSYDESYAHCYGYWGLHKYSELYEYNEMFKYSEAFEDEIILNKNNATVESDNMLNSKDIVVSEEFKEEVIKDTSTEEVFSQANAFYGIWCISTKDEVEAINYAEELRMVGLDAFVIKTNDWSNLNDGWYSVSAGRFLTEADAKYSLSYVKEFCDDAYVKYTGEYLKGVASSVTAFYGIWCISTKDRSEADDYAKILKDYGYDAYVVYTNDWSNLHNGWYAVTTGMYQNESVAKSELRYVKDIYKDAYVKYSGDYLNEFDVAYSQKEGQVICISEILSENKLSYRNCDTYADMFIPLEDIYYMNYCSDVQISILDPDEEYSPYVDSIPVTLEKFAEKVKSAYEWNGYGFICYVVIQDDIITEIHEFYMP